MSRSIEATAIPKRQRSRSGPSQVHHLKNGVLLWIAYAILLAGTLVMVFPFLWMILSSFKTTEETLLIPPTVIPQDPTTENYTTLFSRYGFVGYIGNSLFITAITVVAQVYTSALFGYVIEKFRFRGKEIIFWAVLLVMMVPPVVNTIPMYQAMVSLKWINTYQSVIAPYLVSAFGIFLMRQFAKTIPNELLESGRIDGASEARIFHRIALPLFNNAIAALAVLQFLWNWDSYLWPLLMLNDVDKYTITLGLGALNGQFATPAQLMLAGSAIAVVPILAVYLLLQRRIVQGMASAGLKV